MLEDLSGVAFARQRLQQAERLRDGWPFGRGSRARFQQCVDRVLLDCDLLMSVLAFRHRPEICGRDPQGWNAGDGPADGGSLEQIRSSTGFV
jgi:hypothetical protein